MNYLKNAIAGLVLGATVLSSSSTLAANGYVGIAMPTKSSARWITDGDSMVQLFKDAGYKVDL
jgi:putative multiple sugar transport system substrate-binding protein